MRDTAAEVAAPAAAEEPAEDAADRDSASDQVVEAAVEAPAEGDTEAARDAAEEVVEESAATEEAPYGAGSHAALDDDGEPEGFPIKGNEDSKLYHVPGSSHYDADQGRGVVRHRRGRRGRRLRAAAEPAGRRTRTPTPADTVPVGSDR